MTSSSERMILIFHGIGTPREELPKDEHPYWISEDFFDEILDVVDDHANDREIILTFDDGNKSDLLAAEKLVKRNMKGKFFLLTERFGKAHYISSDEAKALDEMEMEVGLHGYAHVDWRYCKQPELDRETIEARHELEVAAGKKISSLAVPFGAYNRRVINYLRRQDFSRIYTSDAGPAKAHHLFQRRTAVKSGNSMDDIVALLKDNVGMLGRARRAVTPFIKRLR